ncbi:MAG: caspase family protein [Ferruginibacter sp.]
MRKALVVGINNYPSSPLHGCINDATDFKTIMRVNGDGSPNFDVSLETNINSKGQLKGLIKKLFEGKVDTALLYFSGHGYLNELGGYIVTPDFKKYDEGISMDEILTIATRSKTDNKIIILDCCHSGAFGSPAIDNSTAAHLIDGMTILTASKDTESAMEVNGHGVFTNLLLDALQGGAADIRGRITPGSIYSFIDQSLGSWDQRPVFKTNVTRFTCLRTVTPSISDEILRKLTAYFKTPQEEYLLNPSYEDTNIEEALPLNVAIFKNLQKMARVGLVVPVGEEHMYDAAQKSKKCKLTALGYHYWRLVKDERI